jgi:hypothetical protein
MQLLLPLYSFVAAACPEVCLTWSSLPLVRGLVGPWTLSVQVSSTLVPRIFSFSISSGTFFLDRREVWAGTVVWIVEVSAVADILTPWVSYVHGTLGKAVGPSARKSP